MTNNNTADPEPPEGGESGEEEQPEGSDGAVTVKIEQYFNAKGFSEENPKVEQTDEQVQWDRDNQTLTWNDVTIEAGEEWSQTITVLIDTANLTSIDALPTNLISQAMVFDAESEDPENEPLATKEAEEIDLKTFVGEKISPVEGLEKEFEQDVHWRDNNDLSGRPTSPQEFAGGVRLQFYIGNTEPTDDSGWTTLTAETMGQLGLTAETLPQVTTNSAHEDALWELTAQVPAKIQYGSGTVEALQAEVNWRIVPPETPSAYYFHTIEGSSDWYYLKK